jgi:hypothetical protein
METELILSRGGFPSLSARGCSQQIMPIEEGALRRTINGVLVYTGKEEGHKYRSIISCEDKTGAALEGLWRGSEIRIGCIQRFWQKSQGREVLLERDPVEGSVFALEGQTEFSIEEIVGRHVVLEHLIDQEVFVSYRPWLHMRVVGFCLMTNEWGLKAGWKLEVEEI